MSLEITKSALYTLVFGVILFLFFKLSLILFFYILFISLDLLINFIKSATGIPDLPFDPIAFGSLYLGYAFSFTAGAWLVPFNLLSQIIFGRIQLRHFLKLFSLAAGVMIASVLKDLPAVMIIPLAYAIRYCLDYLLEIIFLGRMDLSRAHVRAINVFVSYLILGFLHGSSL